MFADTLINITERYADDISKEWCRAVRSNPRTEAYHQLTERDCFPRALEFYKNLRKIYFSERPYTELRRYFSTFATEAYNDNNIPLSDALYALIMMRRHIRLFAEFQETFTAATEHRQVVESVNKTIRIFDHGIYIVTRYYEEMNQRHPGGPS